MNFQNIPRDLKVVKRAFVPKQEMLHFFDYSQVEPRLTAYFAEKIGYPDYADKIRAGTDSYVAVAELITGKTEVTKEERQVWKRVFLSLLYGGGIRTIGNQIRTEWKPEMIEAVGVDPVYPEGAAKHIINRFHASWPAVRALQDMVIAVHARRGYIKTPWGRHLHAEEYGEHKLLNKLIQGSAADLMKESLIKVDAYLDSTSVRPIGGGLVRIRSHMVSVVHDEIQMDGPAEEAELLHKRIPQLMRNDEIHAAVPILVDHEVSMTSWADKIDYDEWKENR